MSKPSAIKESFVVKVLSQQNSTWQGTVTWNSNNESRPFRSALELIKLIDSALESDTEEGD